MVNYKKIIKKNCESPSDPASSAPMQYQRKKILPYVIAGFSLAALLSWSFLDMTAAKWLRHYPMKWTSTWYILGIRQLGKAWAPIWLLLLWAAVTRRTRPVTTAILALTLTMALILPLKAITNRTRPRQYLHQQNQTQTQNSSTTAYSFPSGDTSTVCAVTGVLIYILPWSWWAVCISTSAVIGLMRILILAHYVSDVCAGAAIGFFCAYMALIIDQNCKFDSSILDKRAQTAYLGVLILPLLWLIEGISPALYFMSTIGIIALIWAAAVIFQKNNTINQYKHT